MTTEQRRELSPLEVFQERTTIEFPTPQNLDQTKKLLTHLERTLPYHIGYHINIDGEIGGYLEKEENAKHKTTSFRIYGTIRDRVSHDSSTFESERSPIEARIKRIKFITTPGSEWERMERYRKSTLAIWDNTKEAIRAYFSGK